MVLLPTQCPTAHPPRYLPRPPESRLSRSRGHMASCPACMPGLGQGPFYSSLSGQRQPMERLMEKHRLLGTSQFIPSPARLPQEGGCQALKIRRLQRTWVLQLRTGASDVPSPGAPFQPLGFDSNGAHSPQYLQEVLRNLMRGTGRCWPGSPSAEPGHVLERVALVSSPCCGLRV